MDQGAGHLSAWDVGLVVRDLGREEEVRKLAWKKDVDAKPIWG